MSTPEKKNRIKRKKANNVKSQQQKVSTQAFCLSMVVHAIARRLSFSNS